MINQSLLTKGSVIFADLGEITGENHLQKGKRPCIVVTNIKGSNKLTVIPVTSRIKRTQYFNHVVIEQGEGGLNKESMALLEDITTIANNQIIDLIGIISEKTANNINVALRQLIAV